MNLLDVDDWSPASLSPQSQSEDWGQFLDLINIQNLCKRIRPNGFSVEPIAVIRTTSLDSRTGTLRKGSFKPENTFYDWTADGLETDDLLICSSGALLLSPELRDVLFSSDFVALRCKTQSDAALVWAFLNSTRGKALLSRVFNQSTKTHIHRRQEMVSVLMESEIPTPGTVRGDTSTALRALHRGLLHDFSSFLDKRASWFRVTRIDSADDWLFLAKVQSPKSWADGTPLAEYVQTVVAGRFIARSESSRESKLVPAINRRFMNHQLAADLVHVQDRDSLAIGLPGDILFCPLFRNTYVYPLTFRCALGPGVFALRPRTFALASFLQSALQSQTVQEQISYLQSRSISGPIFRRDIETLRLPEQNMQAFQIQGPTEPLANRLDALLWN